MKTYFVYILQCADNSYYTGITNNLTRRIAEHQEGCNPQFYTFFRRPITLKFFETFSNVNDAIKFEKQVKGWSRKEKEALIDRNRERLKNLAICKNNSFHKNYENS